MADVISLEDYRAHYGMFELRDGWVVIGYHNEMKEGTPVVISNALGISRGALEDIAAEAIASKSMYKILGREPDDDEDGELLDRILTESADVVQELGFENACYHEGIAPRELIRRIAEEYSEPFKKINAATVQAADILSYSALNKADAKQMPLPGFREERDGYGRLVHFSVGR